MIRMLHLFPNLMNLYGDWGNAAVLAGALERMGASVELVETDNADRVDPRSFDWVFIGAGTERRTAFAARRLADKAGAFAEAAEAGTAMLFTGSACELACRRIEGGDEPLAGLGLFDAVVRRTEERQTGDVLYASDLSDRLCAGFLNKSGFLITEEAPLFRPIFGPGSFEDGHQLDADGEGLARGGVIATYVTGPILVRNPWLKRIVADGIFSRACPGAVPRPYDDGAAEKGWKVTVSELEKRKAAAAGR
jgi:CobQ-like glutamine amidotransferase family enzyme